MLTRLASIAVIAIALTPLADASPFGDAASRLDGRWQGDGFVLRIDASRAQGSFDANRPFQWQHFIVKEVTEDGVIFAIGNELFEATVDAEALRLSGTSFRGEKLLRRAPEGTLPSLEARGSLP
jgi:hypothetical protein